MQRTMKKTFSFVLALALVFTMCIGVFSTQAQAADNNSLAIAESEEDFTFGAYQIFSGDYTTVEVAEGVYTETLSNVDWGSGIDKQALATDEMVAAINSIFNANVVTIDNIAEKEGAQAIAEALSGVANDSATAKAFAELMGQCLNSSAEISMTGPTNLGDGTLGYVTESNLADGYYLIKTDEVPTLSDGTTGAFTEYILAVVGGGQMTVVDEKEDVPESNKHVGDVNDSDPDNEDPDYNIGSDKGSSGDWDIGDWVPFTLTGTVSDYYADFTSYDTTLHDTMTSGLTFDPTSEYCEFTIYIVTASGEHKITLDSNYTYSVGDVTYVQLVYPATDGCTFDVVFTNFKDMLAALGITDFNAGTSTIKVTFNAQLNENAKIGNGTGYETGYNGGDPQVGNMNKSHLTFSNDVYNDNSYGSTPDVQVRVYTYGFTVNKVDQNKQELEGAAFDLEKFVVGEGSDTLTVDGNEVTGSWVKVTMDEYDGEEGTQTEFAWTGIDDGYYRIHESETPAGYNSIDDIYFVVTAKHDTTETTLTIYDAKYDNGTLTIGGVSTGIYVDQSTGATGGEIMTTVENQAGSSLPSTGGIGTTIFYIVGAGIVLCAVVVLVTRRRMRRAA